MEGYTVKKLLALILCFSLIFCVAHAEIEVPQLPPSQEALQMGFFGNLLGMISGAISGVSSGEKALKLEVSKTEQPLLDALLQKANGVFDLSGSMNGTAADAQFTNDAMLFSIGDQVFRVPYESLATVTFDNTSSPAQTSTLSPMALQGLVSSFIESAIMPSITVEDVEGGRHIVFDLTRERLAESLVALGDSVAEDEQLLALLATCGLADFDQSWPQLRQMVEEGLVQLALHADITLGDRSLRATGEGDLFGVPVTLNADVDGQSTDFNLSINDNMSLNGHADNLTGAYTCHSSGFGDTDFDIVSEPTEDGWHYTQTMTRADATVFACEATLSAAAFEADMSCLVDADSIVGSLRFDRATSALEGNLTLPEALGGLVYDLTGEKTEDGYHAVVEISQMGEQFATVDSLYTQTDEAAGLEVKVLSAGETPETMMQFTFAYALRTGAFNLRYSDVDGTYCNGDGVLTANRKNATFDIGDRDRLIQRHVFKSDTVGATRSFRYTNYQDRYYSGGLSLISDLSFDLDRETGTFRGSYLEGGSLRVNVQGRLTDGLLNFRFDSEEYGHFSGALDVNARWDDKAIHADYTYNNGYDIWTGDLLWSDTLKIVNLNGDRQRFFLSLEQNPLGIPQAMRLTFSQGYSESIDISIDNKGITANINGEIYAVTGGFTDANTYRLDISQLNSYSDPEKDIQILLTAKNDVLDLSVTNGAGASLFNASATLTDPTDFEPLETREDIMELTPELLQSMFMTSGTPAQDAPTAEEEPAVGD